MGKFGTNYARFAAFERSSRGSSDSRIGKTGIANIYHLRKDDVYIECVGISGRLIISDYQRLNFRIPPTASGNCLHLVEVPKPLGPDQHDRKEQEVVACVDHDTGRQ